MKKVMSFIVVSGLLSLMACGSGSTTTEKTDSTAVEAEVPAQVDSVAPVGTDPSSVTR